jgi:hypothetical protein
MAPVWVVSVVSPGSSEATDSTATAMDAKLTPCDAAMAWTMVEEVRYHQTSVWAFIRLLREPNKHVVAVLNSFKCIV